MGVTNTLSKLKEYFEAWHNSNYDRLHEKTTNLINTLTNRVGTAETKINNITNNEIPRLDGRIDELDGRVTQYQTPIASDIDFSVLNDEMWQMLNSPQDVQAALDNLYRYTYSTFEKLLGTDTAYMTDFNPSITWNQYGYVCFTRLGSIGICEYWIRTESSVSAKANTGGANNNGETVVGTIPVNFRPKSPKYYDSHNWGGSVGDYTDDGGARVMLFPNTASSNAGKMLIHPTRTGKVNCTGSFAYVMDDDVYKPGQATYFNNG